MVVREGYKQTEIGVIPDDWMVQKISNFTDGTAGGTPSTLINDYWGGDIPWMSSGELHLKNVYDVKERITKKGLKNSSTKLIPPSCTLIGLAGQGKTRGTVAINRVSLCTNQSIAAIYPNVSYIADYLYHYLDSKYKELRMLSTGDGGRGGLNLTIIRNIEVPLPAKLEQKSIAKALNDVDILIASLEQLISKKQLIKQGAMQELLMGKRRLPGFEVKRGYKQTEIGEIPEDWKAKSILSIVSNIIDYRGVTPKKKGMEWGNGNIVALSAGNVKKGYIDFDAECYYGSEALYKRWMTNGDTVKDDIVFTLEAPLGNVALIPDNKKYILSQRTILLQIQREIYHSKYIYQVLLSESFQNYINSSSTGTTAKGIKRKIFEQLLIPIPPKLEQNAIATILSDMDNELKALETKLQKTKQIKEGMMHELLTGRIRLI